MQRGHRQVLRGQRRHLLRSVLVVVCALFLAACKETAATGDVRRGEVLFGSKPCSGCHGTMAQGQYGPALAGTSLSFADVKRQVRAPRDKMPAFDEAEVSEKELRDIYSWLVSLTPSPTTPAQALPAAEATAQARDRFFPKLDAAALSARRDALEEAAFRVDGRVTRVTPDGRFTQVRIAVAGDEASLLVAALYDTAMARQPFPAKPGDLVTVYGIGAKPLPAEETGGSSLPRLQILKVIIH